MRALVIEDEPDLLWAIATAIREAGYAVDVAPDGQQGLHKAQSDQYDVIVLDLMLPKLDGWTLLKKLRAGGHATPVLILTARDALPDRVKGLDTGADDYLTKPFELAGLLGGIRALIRRSAGKSTSTIDVGDVRVDTIGKQATKGGAPVSL